MKRINCICKIEDDEFRRAFELHLLSSKYFLLKGDEAEEGEKRVYFFDDNSKGDGEFNVFLSPYRNNEDLDDRRLEIFKYSPFSEIEKEVVSKFGDSFGIEEDIAVTLNSADEAEVVSFFSLSGGSGTTTLSLSVARELFRNGSIPLYLSITPVASWQNRITVGNMENDNREIVKLLYDIRKGRIPDISRYTSRVGDINTIGSPLINRYANEIAKTEINILRKAVKAAGYDILILDLGNCITEDRIEIIRHSMHKVHILSGNTDNLIQIKTEVKNLFGRDVFNVINNTTSEGIVSLDIDSTNGWSASMDMVIPYFETFDEKTIDGEYGDYARYLSGKIEQRMADDNVDTNAYRKKNNGGDFGTFN